jgi:hypothetical protein
MASSTPTHRWRRSLRHRLTILASAAALSLTGLAPWVPPRAAVKAETAGGLLRDGPPTLPLQFPALRVRA